MNRSPLGRVPAEVRTNIYQHLFRHSRIFVKVDLSRRPNQWQSAVLLTCRAINDEAGPVLASATKLVVAGTNLDDIPTASARRFLPHLRSLEINMMKNHPYQRVVELKTFDLARLPRLQAIHFKTHNSSLEPVIRGSLPGPAITDRSANNRFLNGRFDDAIQSRISLSDFGIAVARWSLSMQLERHNITCKSTFKGFQIMYSHPAFLKRQDPVFENFYLTFDSANSEVLKRKIILMSGDIHTDLMVKSQDGSTRAFKMLGHEGGDGKEQVEASNWTQAFRKCYGIAEAERRGLRSDFQDAADAITEKSTKSTNGADSEDEDDLDNGEDLHGNPDRLERERSRFREWWQRTFNTWVV